MSHQFFPLKKRKSLLLACWISFMVIGCNNDSKKDPEQNKPADSTSIQAVIPIENFPVLCISKTQLEALFDNSPQEPVHKLVFIANLNDAEQRNPSLTAFRARANGTYYPGGSMTLQRLNRTYPITGEYLIGNLELTENYYNQTLRTAPGYQNAQGLYFYPVKLANNRITYRLYWGDCNIEPPDVFIMAPPPPPADGELNPSPPAPPQ